MNDGSACRADDYCFSLTENGRSAPGTIIAGGAGGTTTIAGVYQILDTMVEAHGIYVECLYAHIANQ